MAPVTVTRPTTHPARRAPSTAYLSGSPVFILQAASRGNACAGLSARGTAKKIVAQAGRCSAGVAAATSVSGAVKRIPQGGRVTLGVTGGVVPAAASGAGSYTHVTITRDYDLADGAAPIGVVYFTPSEWLLNNGVTLVAAPVAASLDVDGRISISLAANTDPGTTPVGSHYQVREAILGQPERTYKVSIPYNAGLTIDLATLPVIP